ALVLILPLGALSDRVGRRPLLVAGAIGFAVLAYPSFLLLNSGSLTTAILAHCLLGAMEAIFVAASLVAATELFATRVRYSGLSVGYNVSVAVFGGTTPYVVTLLAARTGNDYAAGIYVVIAAVVSLLTVFKMRETAAKPLVALGNPARGGLRVPASP
ncbi:MAG TPA: MFS transporter, partial [Mycobacterium sp.]|nr:MFS transporter [Mycobacterium sp.]